MKKDNYWFTWMFLIGAGSVLVGLATYFDNVRSYSSSSFTHLHIIGLGMAGLGFLMLIVWMAVGAICSELRGPLRGDESAKLPE